ncbi:MAG TPA: tetratricopeptide repeat protein [Candidatus Krumholzibacteria bacterium]|nr:tetratricopeptide repeat protein [Candidatus Krumholzibacteria bacterium]
MGTPAPRTWILVVLVFLVACGSSPPELMPNGPTKIASDAYELRMAGEVDDAVRLLKAGLAAHPESGVLHYELARTDLFLLDIENSRNEAAAAVDCAPRRSDYRYFAALASAYSLIEAAHQQDQERMKSMGAETIDQLETLLQNDPDHARARYLLVQQIVEMAPDVGLEVDDPMHHVEYLEARDPILGAKARCCLVDKTEQRRIWMRILDEHPHDVRAQVEAAEGLIGAGRLFQAEKCLTRAIEADSHNCYGLLRLGLAYAVRRDWVHALELTERYLRHDPPLALRAYALGRLSVIHRQMGDPEGAEELASEARDIDPHVWMTVMPPPREIFTPIVSAKPEPRKI